MQRRRLLCATAATALLAGCGYRLQRAPVMAFRSIALVGFAPRSPLGDELRRSLAPTTQLIDNPAKAEVVLQALEDVRDRIVVASTAAGLVRDLQLRVRFRFRLSTPAGRSLIAPTDLLQTRDMSYTETAALAKEQEQLTLFRAMDADLVDQILRRLAAVTEI